MSKQYDDFRKRQEILSRGDNFKMFVVATLIVSVVIFSALGDDLVRPFILYWAGLMLALLCTCIAIDIANHRKLKKL